MNAAVPVIGVVAPSGSGKTTLLRQLVAVLRQRGLRIGYLKHAHHSFDLDVPGKDSFELRAAGAAQTLLASRERWALLVEEPAAVDPDLNAMLARFETAQLDLILVEGFKHARYPKIEVYRAATGQPVLYPTDPDIIAVASAEPLPVVPHPPHLPLQDVPAIAAFILRQVAH
ncbi:molybdopterin-guanine dinucleotide biosynthesis protein B [Chromatium okenii]|uniref:molybdopterin-guanine dinucleotide biosynthesis protein B n=1 Tax=Chromatium okenii TaxID=61644 RepID=UPI00190856E8|nr:molybdopterin-guanine dinucleotide biosynthesis protein B [Chromatium okenii]